MEYLTIPEVLVVKDLSVLPELTFSGIIALLMFIVAVKLV